MLHRWTPWTLMRCGARLAGVQEPLNEAEPSSLCLTTLFILHRGAAEHLSSFLEKAHLYSAPADPRQSSLSIHCPLFSKMQPTFKK